MLTIITKLSILTRTVFERIRPSVYLDFTSLPRTLLIGHHESINNNKRFLFKIVRTKNLSQ